MKILYSIVLISLFVACDNQNADKHVDNDSIQIQKIYEILSSNFGKEIEDLEIHKTWIDTCHFFNTDIGVIQDPEVISDSCYSVSFTVHKLIPTDRKGYYMTFNEFTFKWEETDDYSDYYEFYIPLHKDFCILVSNKESTGVYAEKYKIVFASMGSHIISLQNILAPRNDEKMYKKVPKNDEMMYKEQEVWYNLMQETRKIKYQTLSFCFPLY